jgi:hypothetical protein
VPSLQPFSVNLFHFQTQIELYSSVSWLILSALLQIIL